MAYTRVFVLCNVTFLGSVEAAIMRWNIRPAKQQKFSWNCALDKPAALTLSIYIHTDLIASLCCLGHCQNLPKSKLAAKSLES